ncbi:MAG: IclR family transcriptional regulator, partial [Acidimicrobiia bacterium]
VGHRNVAHCTSTGKVLLAYLPEAELDLLLGGWVLEPKTRYTITDPARLRRDLAQVRHRGYAENLHEAEMGIVSVAAPVRDASGGVVAAVSVAAPEMRLEGSSVRRFAATTVQAADSISRRLGYQAGGAW